MDSKTLGNRIREARTQKQHTQQRLAEIAGISQMYLGEIERGAKMPSLRSFIKIIEALDLSADYVLRDELSSGEHYIYDEITEKLKNLSPQQSCQESTPDPHGAHHPLQKKTTVSFHQMFHEEHRKALSFHRQTKY